MRCFDKCHNLLCLVLFGMRACGQKDEKIYVISTGKLQLHIPKPVGMSYQPHFFSSSFPLRCLFSTSGNAAGALIPQFSQILLIKCVDLLILHNGITSLRHDIVLKYALCSFSIGNREVTTKCCMNHVEGNFSAFTILLYCIACFYLSVNSICCRHNEHWEKQSER